MTVEEWLQRVKRADDRVEELINRRLRMFNLLCGSAIDTSNEKVQTSQRNAVEDKIIAYVNCTEMINRAIDEFVDIRHKAESAINQVECYTYRELLRMRYIEYREWEYISNKLNINRNSAKHRIKKAALYAVAPYCV